MNFRKISRLGLVVFSAALLPFLAARSEEKKAEAKAQETRYMESVEIIYPSADDPTIVSKIIYISGDNYRIEKYDGEGKGRKLDNTRIIKGGYEYMYFPDNGEGKVYSKIPASYAKEKDMYKSAGGDCIGMKWSDALATEWRNTASRKVSITKQPNEKWTGIDCEVHKVTDNLDPERYHLYYIDSKKIVRRWLRYYLLMSESNDKKVLESEWNLFKYEVGKTFPKDTFEIPEGYKEMGS